MLCGMADQSVRFALPPSQGNQILIHSGFADEVLDGELVDEDEFARSHKGDIAWQRNKGDISKLIRYWTHGKGAAKIGWGAPCDFCSCLLHLRKYVPPVQVKGFCAKLHRRAMGRWPGPRSHGKHCPC